MKDNIDFDQTEDQGFFILIYSIFHLLDLFSEVAEPTDPNVVYIYVNVADINDNGPYFLKENYYAGVSTVARVGTQVIAVEVNISI